MECPICGRPLSLLGEVLAATHAGTQCLGCWKLLRHLQPPRRREKVTALRPAGRLQSQRDSLLRRAA